MNDYEEKILFIDTPSEKDYEDDIFSYPCRIKKHGGNSSFDHEHNTMSDTYGCTSDTIELDKLPELIGEEWVDFSD